MFLKVLPFIKNYRKKNTRNLIHMSTIILRVLIEMPLGLWGP